LIIVDAKSSYLADENNILQFSFKVILSLTSNTIWENTLFGDNILVF
jgi:hypothetical protein